MSRPPCCGCWLLPWLLAPLAGCGDSAASATDGATTAPNDAGAVPDGSSGDAGFACTLPSDCRDFTIAGMSSAACCSPATACGYELPPLDPETLMFFPQAADFYVEVTGGYPDGRCAPESYFFGPRPGLDKERVVAADGSDILVTPTCASFTVLAFILPGCCLPDDSCGLSTHQSAPTLAGLAPDAGAPFAEPECVSAQALNQQFRDSITLEPFARTTASGSCDHAALAAELAE
jgi:hypothetical protein